MLVMGRWVAELTLGYEVGTACPCYPASEKAFLDFLAEASSCHEKLGKPRQGQGCSGCDLVMAVPKMHFVQALRPLYCAEDHGSQGQLR